jgi:predicted RND superfamily exporter protein
VVALLLAGASLVAATGLGTEFDRDDFVPEGSEVAERLALQSELFGGGVDEVTFVVIDGDVSAPAVADAIHVAQRQVASVEGVRAVGAEPQVRPDGAAAVVQVRKVVGDAGAARLFREVVSAFAPVADAGARVAVTSEPIIIGEMSDDLSAFQVRAIGVTLALVLVLLVGYYALVHRRPLLGAVAMIPAVVSASLILGAMWLLGISFNILSATLTAIAVGIGVPYGVHVVNRFVEDRAGDGSVDDAVARTLKRTGGALAGSALTTLGAFVVLSFSGLAPIQQLGLLGGTGIAFALLAALLVEPGALVLLARHHERRRPT